ncbi:U5 snRNP complex subunit AAR2 SCDLUD_000170 [Saccharomycodes ludwigii]|uniref:U5 snRNP complex subunit AAR2 n=1 Tax=Saccharomycodes ludwigii TaxID=36035 RepID=UPI001E8C0AAA|nr:hypothetical protein SCDLUD_000170 [Saccharomycodes ludwigii]KAH3902590.1 hypothetical protein SCDLUD_000170 [Saccharomycodes ludwigii]
MRCILFNNIDDYFDCNTRNTGSSFTINLNNNTIFTIDNSNKAQRQFYGIKNINNSIKLHFIQFIHSHSEVCYGYWLNTCDSATPTDYGFRYNKNTEKFEPYEIIENTSKEDGMHDEYYYVKKYYGYLDYMVNYVGNNNSENSSAWGKDTYLLNHITWKNLCFILKKYQNISTFTCVPKWLYCDSYMCSIEEYKRLESKIDLRQTSAHNKATKGLKNDVNNKVYPGTVDYTLINFKSKDAIRNKMEMCDYLDKSYYLKKLMNVDNNNNLLGEFQICFIHVIMLGNYASSLQWHNIIELIMKSKDVFDGNLNYITMFLEIFMVQLKSLPQEYKENLINIQCLKKCFIENEYINETIIGNTTGSNKIARFESLINFLRNYISDILQEEETDEYSDTTEKLICNNNNNNEEYDVIQIWNVDSDDSDDEYKPTVVSGVYHQSV